MDEHVDTSDVLSRYFDDDLERAERERVHQHIASCTRCRAALDDLARVHDLARSLPDVPPAHDAWPAIEARIATAQRARRVSLAAAAVLAAVALFAAGWTASRASSPPSGGSPRFVLLLHEPRAMVDAPRTAQEIEQSVERYRSWARSVARAGRFVSGEKLATSDGGIVERDGREHAADPRADDVLAGFFVVGARDAAEALELARECPHLEAGGWIEVRRIEDT